MKETVIFGLGQFAERMYHLLQNDKKSEWGGVAAFCVDKSYLLPGKRKFGKPVVAFEDLEEIYPPKKYSLLFCIGYTAMNQVREEHIKDAVFRGYEIVSYMHPNALVQTEAIGIGNIFMEGVIIGDGCQIGDGNIFWPGAHIAHDTVVGNFNFFTISCAVAGNIVIHDHCVFGNNCTVKNGVEIGTGTLIGAGAYISHDTEEWSVYVPPRSYKLEGRSSLEFKL